MAIIKKKHFFICILLSFLFISTDVLSPALCNFINVNNNYSIAYAKGSGGSRSSGGGFKSGSFSSPKSSIGGPSTSKSSSGTSKSSTGGFKSGSFSNTPNSSSGNSKSSGSTNSSEGYKSQPNVNNTTPPPSSYNSSKRSFLPIPIPWGHSYYGSNPGYSGYSSTGLFIFEIFKLIIIIIIIIIIIKLIKRYRRK